MAVRPLRSMTLRVLADQRLDIGAGTRGEDTFARDGNSLRDIKARVDGDDFAVDQNK